MVWLSTTCPSSELSVWIKGDVPCTSTFSVTSPGCSVDVHALALLHIERKRALDRRLESLGRNLNAIGTDTHRADRPLAAGIALRAVSQAGINVGHGHRRLRHDGSARVNHPALEGCGILLRYQGSRSRTTTQCRSNKEASA